MVGSNELFYDIVFLQVVRAFYGWGNSHYNCFCAPEDCVVMTKPRRTVQESKLSSSSLSSGVGCDGQQTRFVEVEQSSSYPSCKTYGFHDYMQVQYKCVPGEGTLALN